MEYLHTMLRIRDIKASLHFYCDLLGLKETRRRESAQGRFTLIFLSTPADIERCKGDRPPEIELTYNWDEEDYGSARNFGHLAFRVENIYETCARLAKAGVIINRPPRDGYMAFVRSPDLVSVELLQKAEPLAPAEPWLSMKNTGVW